MVMIKHTNFLFLYSPIPLSFYCIPKIKIYLKIYERNQLRIKKKKQKNLVRYGEPVSQIFFPNKKKKFR